MSAALINLAGIVYALWRAAVLRYVWRRFIPSKDHTDRFVFVISAVTGIVFHFITFPIRGGFLIVHGVFLLAFCAWRNRAYLHEAVFVILIVYAFQTLFVLFMSGMGEFIAPLFFRATFEGVADMSVVEREAAVYQAVFHLIGGFMLTAVWSVISILVCVIFNRPLIHLITGTNDSEVLAISARYIVWNVPFFFVLGVLVVLRSSLQGVGKKLVPIMGSVVEFLLKVLVVMVLAPRLGYFGVCIVEPVIWTVCAAIVLADYALFLRKSSHMNGGEAQRV